MELDSFESDSEFKSRKMISQEELKTIVGSTVTGLGYELVGTEYQARNKNSLLRIYIDTVEDSEQGITLDDCQKVSEQLSAVLDVEDPISERYVLEVSSPGLDRPLFDLEQYEQFVGRHIRLKMLIPFEGRKNFKGLLVAVANDKVEIEVDNNLYCLPFLDIQQARLVPKKV